VAEQAARGIAAEACRAVQRRGVPAADVTRGLHVSDRTLRFWRQKPCASQPACRGRRPQCATRLERNAVFQFLRPRGEATSLDALRAEFPHLRCADLRNLLARYRRLQRRKAQRHRCRLEWRRPGAVWAADFKEFPEPLEGRFGWMLSVKDLGSRCQLAWEPFAEATKEVVSAEFDRLFAEHGPPLVMKSDNGGQFIADEIKRLLAEHVVTPLYNPVRRPRYNGGVERANSQLASHQAALAEHRGRPGMPTREDAADAREQANETARPHGWRGPTADQLWAQRAPIAADERAIFQATVENQRALVRASWDFAPDEALTHYQAAAVDRRAVRDALLARDLLKIHPLRRGRRAVDAETANIVVQCLESAGRMVLAQVTTSSTVDGAADREPHVAAPIRNQSEEAHCSTIKLQASGKN
jgi:transposase InsO family protein